MKKLLAGLALIVATLAAPSSAHADWAPAPGTFNGPPKQGCTSVKVVKYVDGKKTSKVVTSCPFVTTNRIDWD